MKKYLFLATAFFAGFSIMAIEMTSIRQMAPFFSTDMFVWANVIGMVMIFLAAGYFFGGKLADKYTSPRLLFFILLGVSAYIALIPYIANPIMQFSRSSFSNMSSGEMLGTMQTTIVLYALPFAALGGVSPFIIRLIMSNVDNSGKTAGKVYAISTIGSIFGTFVPVFLLIPNIGVKDTFLVVSAILCVLSLIGLGTLKFAPSVILPIALLFVPISPIKAAQRGKLICERESMYNYISVEETKLEDGATPYRVLFLNEGFATHSLWSPNGIHMINFFTCMALGPLLRPVDNTEKSIGRVLMVGLCGGTSANIIHKTYNTDGIDGVEIDGEIIDVAKKYMGLDESIVNIYVQDARYFVNRTDKKYSLVVIDAYQLPYIPFHLCTEEFFGELKNIMTEDGVVVMNVGRIGDDHRLVDRISATVAKHFNYIYNMEVPLEVKMGFLRAGNTIVFATNVPDAHMNYRANMRKMNDNWMRGVLAESCYPHLKRVNPDALPLTDDLAPVENIIDSMILDYLLK